MADIEFVEQLVNSMADAVGKLEEARGRGDKVMFNRLKVFIFDLHRKIDAALIDSGGGI